MFKAAFKLIALGLILGPVLLLMAVTEGTPSAPPAAVPTPEHAATAKQLMQRLRRVSLNPAHDPEITVTLEEMNAVLAFGARVIPGLRGAAELVPEGLRVRLSAQIPGLAALGWVNAEAVVPPFTGPPRIALLRLGHLDLPPETSLAAGIWLADMVIGGGVGSLAREGVTRLALGPDEVTVGVTVGVEGRRSLRRRFAALLRGEDMPTADEIDAYYRLFRAEIDAGRLPDTGSFLPHLRYVVETVGARAAPGRAPHELTAALFGLTRGCGARDFRLVVGRLAGGDHGDAGTWERNCDAVTLAGRIDTRRHFLTAAALKAASTVGVSLAIGEFKELVDIRQAGGFDFTDMVANISGIRFADTLMEAPLEDWPALLDRLEAESDVVAGFEGVPQILERGAFEAQFGDVESPEYRAMLAEIEGRVAALAFNAPLAGTGG